MPPSPADHRSQFLAAFPVSRETEARLERFASMLTERNRTLSLVADSTLEAIWTRHFLDSAQLLPLIPDSENSVIDMGAGPGFPGLVLAILGLPRVHLVENNMQKAGFLNAVIADLALPVTVHAMKVEAVRPFVAGAVTARALKPLSQLIGMGRKFLGEGSVCVFPKGRRAAEELVAAERDWSMRVRRFQSLTDTESTIFRLSHVKESRA
jgi:16S rRNA (guanine527-N7)-methyltransferase